MTKAKRLLIISVALCMIFLCISTPIFGQTKLDIKTKITQKYELRYFKEGLIELLKSDGYEIVEFGEDFAIWIIECESDDDYCMDIELCEPSIIFALRKVIYSKTISFLIPKSVIDHYTTPGTSKDNDNFIPIIILKAATIGLPGGFIAHVFYSALSSKIYNLLNRDPSPREMAEIIYGGAKIWNAVKSLLRKVGQ